MPPLSAFFFLFRLDLSEISSVLHFGLIQHLGAGNGGSGGGGQFVVWGSYKKRGLVTG